MKRRLHLKTAFLLLVGMATLNSCIHDKFDYADPSEPNGESVTLQINVPAGTQPKTRALSDADEYTVNDITVLAFDKTTKKFKGRYSGRVVEGPTNTGGASARLKFEVSLPYGGYDLMIVANALTILNANTAALVSTNDDEDIAAALQMTMGTSGWNSSSTSPTYMPMWGYAKSLTVPDDFPRSTPINLTRMVAKVDIQLGGDLVNNLGVTTDEFRLQSVRVYNYVKQGRLIPDIAGSFDWTAVTQTTLANNQAPSLPSPYTKADSDSEWIDYTLASPYQALKNEIYLFEAPKGVVPATADPDYLENTCLVIGGDYNNSGTTTYYRIDFANSSTSGGVTTYNYLNILRNNSYTVTITGVSGPGHGNEDEALKSTPTNITAHILDWNNENITTIVTDGVYVLGVSQGSYEFSSDARTSGNTDNRLTIVTNHSGGWSATVWDDEAGETALPDDGTTGQPWLRLSSPSGNGNYPDGNEIYFNVDANNSLGDRTAYIHIKAGTLNYKIKVVQKYMYLKITDLTTQQVVSTLSFNSKTSLIGRDPQPRQIMVEWSPVTENVTVNKTAGTTDLTWQTSYSTTLTGGRHVLTIDPEGISTADLAGDPFISKTAKLTFTLGSTSATADLDIDQTHYQLIATGLSSGYSATTNTATIKTNASWAASLTDATPIFSANTMPATGTANAPTGTTFTYTFNGSTGEATFTFTPQTAGLFDDVVVKVKGGSIAPMFARSNIVMYVDANGNKILTFAETAADHTSAKSVTYYDASTSQTVTNPVPAIPANVVGLHFRWGGLVGLASDHTSTTTYVNMTQNDIVFWPKEYEDAGSVPSPWTFTNATGTSQVPWIDNSIISTNSDTSYDAFDGWGTDGKGFNKTTARGDICRYISDMGWVEGKWRMPKQSEYQILYNETYNTTGAIVGPFSSNPLITTSGNGPNQYGYFPMPNVRIVGAGASAADASATGGTAQAQNPDNGKVSFPAAGYRNNSNGRSYHPGYYGGYWSATPSSTSENAYYLYFNSTTALTPAYNSYRTYGFSVRCIAAE